MKQTRIFQALLIMLLFASLGNVSAAGSPKTEPAVVALQSPVAFQVIQREGFVPAKAHEHQAGGPELGFATVPVVGKFPAEAKSFEYRVVPQANAFGHGTDWAPLEGKLA